MLASAKKCTKLAVIGILGCTVFVCAFEYSLVKGIMVFLNNSEK